MCLFAISTTACNFDIFPDRAPKAQPPKQIGSNISIDDARDIASPATSNEGFGSTPEISIDRGNLEGALGPNTKMLFADNISDENQRFDRLENAVQNVANTVDDMEPTVERLKRVEQDLESLTEQLEILLSDKALTPRVRGPNASMNNKTSPAPANLPNVIRDIRVADHGGKTRIVIETNSEVNYSAVVNGNMFTIKYDGALTSIDLNSLSAKSKFINTVSGTQENSQAAILFQLVRDSTLVKEGRIPPNKDNSNHRIYLDLKN